MMMNTNVALVMASQYYPRHNAFDGTYIASCVEHKLSTDICFNTLLSDIMISAVACQS